MITEVFQFAVITALCVFLVAVGYRAGIDVQARRDHRMIRAAQIRARHAQARP